MRIIKVDAIDSTNTFLRNLYKSGTVEELTGVLAHHQTAGRGQKGTIWQSNAGENLTCSVLIPHLTFPVSSQFYISVLISLVLIKVLGDYKIRGLSVKWPNDILSDSQKIAGILIENIVTNRHIHASIIGIGLNVNQTDFFELPQATSLKLRTKKTLEVESIFKKIIEVLQSEMEYLQLRSFQNLHRSYETYLFKKEELSKFKTDEGLIFEGIIKGINSIGQLQILEKNKKKLCNYNLKEVQLIY